MTNVRLSNRIRNEHWSRRCEQVQARTGPSALQRTPAPPLTLRMHPVDLQQERERRLRKAYKNVSIAVYRAALNATQADMLILQQTALACQLRAITPEKAHAEVAAVRDQQRARKASAAA